MAAPRGGIARTPETIVSHDYVTGITGDADITRHAQRALFSITALVVFTTLAGCSVLQQVLEPGTATRPDAPSGAPDVVPPTPPEPLPPISHAEPQPVISRVAILLSDDTGTFEAIASRITRRDPENDYKTFNLDRNAKIPATMLEEIKQFDVDRIVAIGLLAAKAGQQFADTPMVFCQVFNYQDHNLISPRSRGVKLLPPFSLQLAIWKDLSPNLTTVGLIIGPNQEDLRTEIEQAAAQYRVELLIRTVQTDREALYAFKRLTPKIQGFWLLPDNRVLSPGVLREIFSYGRKHGNQTAVFNASLLRLGADISFSSNAVDVADAVLKVLGGITDTNSFSGPPMTSLSTVRAEVNADVSDDLGARASTKIAQYLDEK